MKNTHKAKVLAISCIDFRFATVVRDFLLNEGLKDSYDLITIPGASLGLEKITESILVSTSLHKPDSIYIFDHEDCGAYGDNNSPAIHLANLTKAKKILLEKHANKKVKIFIADRNKIKELD